MADDRATEIARHEGPRIGELFAGYGGLGLGVQAVLGGEVVWYSDVCRFNKDGTVCHHEPHRGACAILSHRLPGVPNLGDVSAVDWSQVAPIDVLTGGSPCQDLSHAGRRAGMTTGTRSNLWVAMREAIAHLRPSLVVWENVRGAYSAGADSAVEPCAGCVGDGSGVSLRALGRVLGDLSDLGYDARWHGLQAADVGAPHGRFRVFVVAEDTQCAGRGAAGNAAPGEAARRWSPTVAGRPGGVAPHQALTLLPTPAAMDGIKAPPGAVDGGGGPKRLREDGRTEADHGPALRDLAPHLLPTPTSMDSHASGGGYNGQTNVTLTDATVRGKGRMQRPHDINQWGDYADAVSRWESATGRPAPSPTQPSAKGNQQLAPTFVEWMMGLPVGWVTDVPGITRNEALKALGNGVVPQQAEAALREMFAWEVVA